MRTCSSVVAVLAAWLTVIPRAARAELLEPSTGDGAPAIAPALLAGGLTAVIPFSLGVSLMATSERRSGRNAGLLLTEVGFVAAPFVAHAVVGEWRRGLLFSALPAAGAVALNTLLIARPSIVNSGAPKGVQFVFVGTTAATLVLSAIATFDVVGAGGRQKKARQALLLVPYGGVGEAGATLVTTW